jgi:hypothetical protein
VPARTTSHPVVTTRDVDALLARLGFRHERLESALERGVLGRAKVGGQWLFFTEEASLRRAREAVNTLATERLEEWFLTPIPWLRASIGKQLDGHELTKGAVEPLLRVLVAEGAFGVAGLLTQEFEPYFALYNLDDEGEVSRQVDRMTELLARAGRVRPRDLPEPDASRTMDAWRGHALRHGEFLGLGSMQSGVLQAWSP